MNTPINDEKPAKALKPHAKGLPKPVSATVSFVLVDETVPLRICDTCFSSIHPYIGCLCHSKPGVRPLRDRLLDNFGFTVTWGDSDD